MSDQQNNTELLELTTEIVSAHVSNNALSVGDLPQLIQDVYRTLSNVGGAQGAAERPQPGSSLSSRATT